MQKVFTRQLFHNPRFIAAIFLLTAIVVTLIKINIDLKALHPIDYISKINNFIIYRNSFFHLINHTTLYGYFPTEQYDEFLYNPTFAILIAPFALLPLHLGATIWAALNAFMVFFAIKQLPLSETRKPFIWWFILIELITSIQNQQVNPMIAALFLLTFSAFEKRQIFWAACFIMLSTFIKVYGILGASLFLLYPDKLKFMAWSIFWGIVFFLTPLLVISFPELIVLYQQWFNVLIGDHAINKDISVMRLFISILKPMEVNFWITVIQLIAILLFGLKYLRIRAYDHGDFRKLFLAAVMMWTVIFSHAAESSTYIIAICGVAVWYRTSAYSKINMYLLLFAFILTCLSPTDLFPLFIRVNYIAPYALKSLPCLLIWIKCESDLINFKAHLSEEMNHA